MPGLRRLAATAALLVLCPMAALAADARAQLKSFVADIKSATGSFTQSTTGPQGRTQRPQSGTFAFQRPGKFKWAVSQPYEQLVVSDGQQLYQYDPDLAQVTSRKVDQAIGTSPAAILFGSGNLEQAFQVAPLPARDGLEWLRAKPRNADAGFAQVDIGMKDNLPVRVELLDAFGQTTRVELSNIQANPALPASEFRFTPPAGVDVVKM
ncbi:outer membrane lipoprotein chaperone LolA [Bordetella petrii]|uniref:Outer-membrane lipoprotein carrier protein n=1 Tax=Bordetella petrii (strain ATCC BAA-461 / DSM 12804 / CCUG 43448 / CIP 107267 / Se-1111R) TaxID=340100 RepID=A9IGE8_BORPD|nr:outer membrane lipoprotein chaperone LolA [Bordetella petrii]CAP41914.1 lolA [Bordetella petrii]